MAFLFQALGVLEHRPANVVADVGELVRFAELHGEVPKDDKARAGPEDEKIESLKRG